MQAVATVNVVGLRCTGIRVVEAEAAQPVRVDSCRRCTIIILGVPETVVLNNVKHARILIVSCSSTVTISGCSDSIIALSAQQAVGQSCARCIFNLDVAHPTALSSCRDITIAPWNVAPWPGYGTQKDPDSKRWRAVQSIGSTSTNFGQQHRFLEDSLHGGWRQQKPAPVDQPSPRKKKGKALAQEEEVVVEEDDELTAPARLAVASLLDYFDGPSLDGGWSARELNAYSAGVGDEARVKDDDAMAVTLSAHKVPLIEVPVPYRMHSPVDADGVPYSGLIPSGAPTEPRLGLDGLLTLYRAHGLETLMDDLKAVGLGGLIGGLPTWRIDIASMRLAHGLGATEAPVLAEGDGAGVRQPVWVSAFNMTGGSAEQAEVGGAQGVGNRPIGVGTTAPSAYSTQAYDRGSALNEAGSNATANVSVGEGPSVEAVRPVPSLTPYPAETAQLRSPDATPLAQRASSAVGVATPDALAAAAVGQVSSLVARHAAEKASYLESGDVEGLVRLLLAEVREIVCLQPPHAYMQLRETMRRMHHQASDEGEFPKGEEVVLSAAQFVTLLSGIGLYWPLPVVAVVAVHIGGRLVLQPPPVTDPSLTPSASPLPDFDAVRLPRSALEEALAHMRHTGTGQGGGAGGHGSPVDKDRVTGIEEHGQSWSPRHQEGMDALVAALSDATSILHFDPNLLSDGMVATLLANTAIIGDVWAHTESAAAAQAWVEGKAGQGAVHAEEGRLVRGLVAAGAPAASLIVRSEHHKNRKHNDNGAPHPVIHEQATASLLSERAAAYRVALSTSPEAEAHVFREYVRDTRSHRWPADLTTLLPPDVLNAHVPRTQAVEGYPCGFEAWLQWREGCRVARALGLRPSRHADTQTRRSSPGRSPSPPRRARVHVDGFPGGSIPRSKPGFFPEPILVTMARKHEEDSPPTFTGHAHGHGPRHESREQDPPFDARAAARRQVVARLQSPSAKGEAMRERLSYHVDGQSGAGDGVPDAIVMHAVHLLIEEETAALLNTHSLGVPQAMLPAQDQSARRPSLPATRASSPSGSSRAGGRHSQDTSEWEGRARREGGGVWQSAEAVYQLAGTGTVRALQEASRAERQEEEAAAQAARLNTLVIRAEAAVGQLEATVQRVYEQSKESQASAVSLGGSQSTQVQAGPARSRDAELLNHPIGAPLPPLPHSRSPRSAELQGRSPSAQRLWMPTGRLHRRRQSAAHILDPAHTGNSRFESPEQVHGPKLVTKAPSTAASRPSGRGKGSGHTGMVLHGAQGAARGPDDSMVSALGVGPHHGHGQARGVHGQGITLPAQMRVGEDDWTLAAAGEPHLYLRPRDPWVGSSSSGNGDGHHSGPPLQHDVSVGTSPIREAYSAAPTPVHGTRGSGMGSSSSHLPGLHTPASPSVLRLGETTPAALRAWAEGGPVRGGEGKLPALADGPLADIARLRREAQHTAAAVERINSRRTSISASGR